MSFILSRLFVLSALFVFSIDAICETRSAPIVQKDLLGAWIGCSHGCTEFYRLELSGRRLGTLVIMNPGSQVDLYEIVSWDVQEEKLRIMLEPVGKAERIEVTSLQLNKGYVQLEIRSKAIGWKRTVILNNEREWEERLRRAREASGRSRQR